jgi:hypothetical protein
MCNSLRLGHLEPMLLAHEIKKPFWSQAAMSIYRNLDEHLTCNRIIKTMDIDIYKLEGDGKR